MKILLFIIIISIPIKLLAQAKDNKELSLGVNLGVIPLGQTKLITGFTYGAEAEFLFGISQSVKLGGNLSYNRAVGKNTQQSFSFLPINLAAKWYPKIFFDKVTSNKLNLGNLFFKGELGHSISSYKSNPFLNSSSLSVGYLFKFSNNQMIDISVAPNRKRGFEFITNDGISFSSISLKYSF